MPRIESQSAPAGYLNVDKPSGWTSADVVAKIRGAFGLKRRGIKIGHGGTLDPIATGVLPICVGSATRFSQYLLNSDKSYEVSIRLGASTDTYDAEGNVMKEGDWRTVSQTKFIQAMTSFIGESNQLPPMYSAVKVDGQPLYRIARRGLSVERETRRVSLNFCEIKAWNPPDVHIHLECGKGFYVRSLIHDIGSKLDCGAYVTALRRIRSGIFDVRGSVGLELLLSKTEYNAWTEDLLPIDCSIQHLPQLEIESDGERVFKHGGKVRLESHMQPWQIDLPVRVYSSSGVFLGLGVMDECEETLHPRLVINR